MMEQDRIWILLGKKANQEATAEELRELEELLRPQPKTFLASEITDEIWNSPMQMISDKDAAGRVWEKLETKINSTPANNPEVVDRMVRRYKRSLVYALAVAVVFVGGFLLYKNLPMPGNKEAISQKQIVTAPAGTRIKKQLPDGTMVWLNGNSKLTYTEKFGNQEREVTLTGEAFFDVVKNEKIPFVIHAGEINVTVKGTAFNVKAYPDDKTIETALIRGSVEVTSTRDAKVRILLKPHEKVVIPKSNIGQNGKTGAAKELFTISKLQPEPNSNLIPEASLMEDKLVFNAENFETLARRMERWYNVTIRFEEETLKQVQFSGSFEKENILIALNALQFSYRFHYRISNNEIIISK